MEFVKDGYEVFWLGEGICRIREQDVWMDLILGEHHGLLFDTGYGLGNLRELILSLTELPVYVVNSHGHVDHACGNWQFEMVFLHSADVGLCLEHNNPEFRRGTLADMEKELSVEFDRDAYLTRGAGELRPVVEGDVFDLGGRVLKVVELPGHTRGSIGLWWPGARLLYVGDAINDFLWLFLPEAEPLSVYRNTLAKANCLPFDRMVQSHRKDPVDRERLEDYIRLVEELNYDAWPAVETPLAPGKEVKIITLPEHSLEHREEPGFAAIMIGRDQVT